MVPSRMKTPNIVVIRPAAEGVFRHSMLHDELARRLVVACREGAHQRAEVRTSRELCDLAGEELGDATLLVVSPFECLGTSGDREAFVSAFGSARRRILASVEPVGSPWYEKQFVFPLRFDAVFDVGFVSREDKHSLPGVAYHFVFNGPTKGEQRTISELSPPRERPIRWALVGYPTARRLELAARLTEELDPAGFVFMPGKPSPPNPDGSPGPLRPLARHEKVSPSGLAAVLSKSGYYVWSSAHDFAHYESFRFVVALRSGAVPCKVAEADTSEDTSEDISEDISESISAIPGTFPSVESLCSAVQEEGAPSMYRLARDFYLSKGLLAAHLNEALELV
jgi:hypothetical protein